MHLWTFVMKHIRPQHCQNNRKKQVLFMSKVLSRKATTKQQQRKHYNLIKLPDGVAIMLQVKIFLWFQLKWSKTVKEIKLSLIRSGRCRGSNLSFVATKELRWQVQCRKKLNKLCLSIHNKEPIYMTFVQISSTLINIQPKLCSTTWTTW